MKTILEFLSTKISDKRIEVMRNENDLISLLSKDIIDKYAFEFRKLKSGNIEAVSRKAYYSGNQGVKFVFYFNTNTKNKKYVLRRQYASDNRFTSVNGWSNPPANMGEFDTIEEMCDKFNKWANDKLSLT